LTWVHERIFAAGGTHIPRTWASFADQTGIGAILHLNPGQPETFSGDLPASYLWLDVTDEEDADHETRWLAGRFAQWQVIGGNRLLIHSSLGLHRTRWVYMSFLLCQGVSLATALRRAQEPPWLAPYHTDEGTWRSFVEWMGAHPVAAGDGVAVDQTQGG
jgi:hypothetical protein